MQFIAIPINILHSNNNKVNHNASSAKYTNEHGVCVISNGTASKCVLADRWKRMFYQNKGGVR